MMVKSRTRIIRLTVALASLVGAGKGLAFNVGTLAAEEPGADYLLVASFLLLTAIILGLWSAGGANVVRRLVRGPQAENLFLNVSLQAQASGAAPIPAHLRKMDLHSATVVTHEPLDRGSKVQLQLSSLPEFKGESESVSAKVIRTRAVRGDPPSYIIFLGWGDLPEASQQDLRQYIANLSGGHRLSPG